MAILYTEHLAGGGAFVVTAILPHLALFVDMCLFICVCLFVCLFVRNLFVKLGLFSTSDSLHLAGCGYPVLSSVTSSIRCLHPSCVFGREEPRGSTYIADKRSSPPSPGFRNLKRLATSAQNTNPKHHFMIPRRRKKSGD